MLKVNIECSLEDYPAHFIKNDDDDDDENDDYVNVSVNVNHNFLA